MAAMMIIVIVKAVMKNMTNKGNKGDYDNSNGSTYDEPYFVLTNAENV